MAMELMAKAVALAPVLVRDLDLPFAALGDATFGDLGGGKKPRWPVHIEKLRDVFDVPWLKHLQGDAAFSTLDELQAKLRTYDASVKKLYNATRYPDEWADDMPAPSEIFTREDAREAMNAMACRFGACRQHLGDWARETPPADWSTVGACPCA
jgi:hypothetical protein